MIPIVASGRRMPVHGKEQYAPVLATLVVFQLVFDHANNNIIGDKSSSIHNLFRFQTKLCFLANLFAQHVASGQVADAKLIPNFRCLRSFAWKELDCVLRMNVKKAYRLLEDQ